MPKYWGDLLNDAGSVSPWIAASTKLTYGGGGTHQADIDQMIADRAALDTSFRASAQAANLLLGRWPYVPHDIVVPNPGSDIYSAPNFYHVQNDGPRQQRNNTKRLVAADGIANDPVDAVQWGYALYNGVQTNLKTFIDKTGMIPILEVTLGLTGAALERAMRSLQFSPDCRYWSCNTVPPFFDAQATAVHEDRCPGSNSVIIVGWSIAGVDTTDYEVEVHLARETDPDDWEVVATGLAAVDPGSYEYSLGLNFLNTAFPPLAHDYYLRPCLRRKAWFGGAGPYAGGYPPIIDWSEAPVVSGDLTPCT